MNPDTFFFVDLILDQKVYSYGPYLDLESATIILFDLMPALANIKAQKNKYTYECRVVERIMDVEKEWEEISIHLIRNPSIVKKRQYEK